MKETNSPVDIGYHYVAVGSNGQPLDFDGNGLPDYLDDADNDGLGDQWEVMHFGSIATYGANDDPDGDWLTNLQEYLAGSNPADTMVVVWGDNSYGQAITPTNLLSVISVGAGAATSLALQSDGRVRVWGANDFGQTNVPADLTNAVRATAGALQLIAIHDNGTIRLWGHNPTNWTQPPTNLANVAAVASGHLHSIALQSNGLVVAWGDPDPHDYPPDGPGANFVPTNLTGVTAIAAGWYHNIARKGDGTITVWGDWVFDAAYDTLAVPTNLTAVTAIAGGFLHSLAVRSNGTVAAWGDNQFGQCDVPAGLSNVASVAAAAYGSMARRADGTVVAWGETPTPPAGLTGVFAIAAGINAFDAYLDDHWIAVRSGRLTPVIMLQPVDQAGIAGTNVSFSTLGLGLAGVRYQWQFNSTNLAGATNTSLNLTNVQLANDGAYRAIISNGAGSVTSSVATFTLITTPVIATTGPTRVWMATNASYPYQTNLSVNATAPAQWAAPIRYFWYSNTTLLATNSASSNFAISRFDMPGERTYSVTVSNAAGTTNLTFLVQDYRTGGLVAWGDNTDPDPAARWDMTNAIAIAVGADHSLLLNENGTVAAWGNNASGQTNVSANLTNATGIAAGWDHNLALKADGTVVAWGLNSYGQTNVPSGLTNIVAVSARGNQSLALSNNGTVTHWGQSYAAVPTNLTNVAAIAAGGHFNLALRSNGTVIAWGDNSNGETNVPAGLTNVVGVAAGVLHGLALKVDGTVTVWGNNALGQTNVPAGLSNVMAIAAGHSHSLALRNDGSVVSWGSNNGGETNVGSGLGQVKAIAAGVGHSMALVYAPFTQYAVDVTKDVLLIYNTNSADSSNVWAYYMANRPMITGANVLGIGTHPQETVSRETFTNTIRNPIVAWLNANPTKRPQYWVMIQDIPTRLNEFTNQTASNYYAFGRDYSVSFELHTAVSGIRPFINYIDMGSTNATRAYIDKMASFGSNYSPGKLMISAVKGGYSNTNFVFDDLRGAGDTNKPSVGPLGAAGVSSHDASAGLITTSGVYDNGVLAGHLTNGVNVAGYLSWGVHSALGNSYATNGSVRWSGNSAWYLMTTVESFNGMKVDGNGQGYFVQWFSESAFGGTNFSCTPVGVVVHPDEPGFLATDPLPFYGYWAAGKNFGVCAWSARQGPWTVVPNRYFTVIGDPFVTR